MLRVAVDGRALARGRGIGRYAATMLDALKDRHPDDRLDVVAGFRVPQQLVFGAAATLGRPRLDRLAPQRPDVVWLPAPVPVAISPGTPYVLTVHDLSWLRRPQDFTRYERLWHALARIERLASRAALVLCDSEATRADLAAAWPKLRTPTRVLAPGVAPLPAPERDPRLPGRFLLHVGALEPRKAPDVLLAAYARARERGLECDLVFAGRGRLAPELHGPGVHVIGDLGDAGLSAAYADALALVMPSRLEGFGLPPLEARLAGTPAIVSDLPVFRETLGADATFVPVGDAEALAGALLDAPDAPRPEPANAFAPGDAADALHDALHEAAR